VRFQLERVADMFRCCKAAEVKVAATEKEAEGLWKARKSIGGMMGALRRDYIPEDITVPMSQIAAFLRGSEELSRVHGLDLINFGHAGDGNLHTNVIFDGTDPGQMTRLEALLYDLHKLACDLGGTLSGEHGIGMTKAKYMPLEHDQTALKTMRVLKKALDPNNILNPGKMMLPG